jgi:hypothetical protein
LARFVGFYLPIKRSGSAGYLEGGVGKAGLRAHLSSRSDWPVDPGGLGWIRPLGGGPGGGGGLAGGGRGPRSSASHGRVPGVGNRVAAGEAYSVPEPEARRLHRRRSHNDLGASRLSSGFVTQFSPSPTWPAGQSPICAHRRCNWDPPCLRPGSVGGTGEGRGEDGTWPHVTFHRECR